MSRTQLLLTAAAIFLVTVTLSVLATLLVRTLAPLAGWLDRPDNRRKLHGKPVALGGGLAVFVAATAVLGGLMLVDNPWQDSLRSHAHELLFLFLSGAMIVALGLVDDRCGLPGRVKLLGQIAAALVRILGGQTMDRIGLFGQLIELGPLAVPFPLFWLLGAINAINLLDGIDGLAATLGFIMACTIAVMAMIVHAYPVAVVALVFASSLLGFLCFNFPPATIFLGDAGSMLIGLVVGSLAIRGALKGPGTVLLAAPLAVLAIPIFDSLAAILRRKLTGRSIYVTDRGHLHHRLLDLMGSNRKVLLAAAIFCLLTSLGTLLSVSLANDLIALLACSALVIILIATGVFGRAEIALLANRVRSFGVSLLEPTTGRRRRVRQGTVRLQGSRPWESLWSQLLESAEKLSLIEIRMDVNAPRSREGFHAFWELPVVKPVERQWHIEIPLLAGDQTIGTLVLSGQSDGASVCEDIEKLLVLLDSFETQLKSLADDSALVLAGHVGPVVSMHGPEHSPAILRIHPK